MVRLVPSFLKNVIPGVYSSTEESTNNTEQDEGTRSSEAPPPITPIKDKEALEVTTNIATIALIDWGPPKLGTSTRTEDSGSRSIFNFFGTSENLSTSRTCKVPKVQESDFALYIQQIGDVVLQGTMQPLDSVIVPSHGQADATSDKVQKKYFEESYQLSGNKVFQLGLEQVPESIAHLESQLNTVNMQLSDLVGTHLRHVSNSFSCVGEVKDCFFNAKEKLNGIRCTFDSVQAHLYSSPTSCDAPESDNALPQILAKRKEIRGIISKLETLKAIVSTPDYIQGIVDISNIALAHIFCTLTINYFNDLSKFTLVNSVALVIKDTIANLERVADAKFIDLVNYTFTECFISPNVDDVLSSTLGKIEPILIVLIMENSLKSSLQTLEIMYSRTGEDKTPSSFPKDTLECIRNAYKWYTKLVQRIVCISLMHSEGKYKQSQNESKRIVEQVFLVMHKGNINTTQCDYSTLLKATTILKELFKLPEVCIFQSARENEEVLGSTPNSEASIEIIITSIRSLKVVLDELVTRHLVSSLHAFCTQSNSVESADALYSSLELLDDSFGLVIDEIKLMEESCMETTCNIICREYIQHFIADPEPLVSTCRELLTKEDRVQMYSTLFREKINYTGKILVESLYAECLGNVHNDLLGEDWTSYQDLHYDCNGTIKPFKLSNTVRNMYEQLKVCQKVCKMFPDNIELLSRCINTFAHYNTLMEMQIDETGTVRKFCLILESLRFFTFLIPQFIKDVISVDTTANEELEYHESLVGLGSNAEKCVVELRRLYKRALEALSGQMFATFTPLILEWIFYDAADTNDYLENTFTIESMETAKESFTSSISSASHVSNEDFIETDFLAENGNSGIEPFITAIKEAFEEISDILGNLDDLRYIFKTVFDKLLIVVTSQDPPIEKSDRFSNDCTKILTGLLHCTQIKLETFAFANALSNELS
ncbi:conserved hypothetical protein [Theileria equi strain WA]|uniref:Uncharacterized protein n=1 Tax=Theileria equi strain WA TaxID=1537102 RepID=L1LDZ9_THEEQ|nr:conserved hypothetical protein [Theileria equi strain WA]EKX73475.1 conserved hypothetical protein [Theileria equi strain WA]|eukprot:XP_004832927.1 conserved hypothetical protein [Theileria equi strain WA]